ncbi:hypothetical protein [Pseudonocardia oroxyli]|uniref:Uncharacterized protein n=1 Tax=Pseudonocardia oroxyli TaxID=366584 RepID=A0A1G7VSN6_PSEOR|nr:hypothetical protein [Pseudonocardia oroxyli]SDG62822.1 hypothetical protein SAMN05216377_113167 [Pseudonocardia oroxyli]
MEIAAGDRDWTVVYGEQAGLASCGAMLQPFDPPLTVPGLLLLPADGARECADALAAAFS